LSLSQWILPSHLHDTPCTCRTHTPLDWWPLLFMHKCL
jgi:hypothetical protein